MDSKCAKALPIQREQASVLLVLQEAATAQLQQHRDTSAGDSISILLRTANTWGEREGRPK